ncbi:MAG: MFS transporter, partial [Gammaproteobacteria bacterium]|nr:MFS transporter [Gammaproteobacteria bacterium]
MGIRSTFGGLKKNKALNAVILEGFFARLGFGIITFALPFYALALGMSFTEVGVLAALRLAGAVMFKPSMGRLADRIGKKRLYLYSIAGRALVGLLFVFASAPWMLFAIRFLHGVTTAARDPASAVLIAELGDDNRMASAFSWYNAAKEAGAAIGYVCAGFLLTYTQDNYSLVFGISVLTSLVALIFIAAWVHEPPVIPETAATSTTTDAQDQHKGALLEIAVLGFFIAATGGMLTNLFPIIATEYAHLSKAETSLIFTCSTVFMVAINPAFGWLADHVGRGVVLSVRAIGNAISSVIYLVFPSFWGFAIARFADDAGKAAFRPAWG